MAKCHHAASTYVHSLAIRTRYLEFYQPIDIDINLPMWFVSILFCMLSLRMAGLLFCLLPAMATRV